MAEGRGAGSHDREWGRRDDRVRAEAVARPFENRDARVPSERVGYLSRGAREPYLGIPLVVAAGAGVYADDGGVISDIQLRHAVVGPNAFTLCH